VGSHIASSQLDRILISSGREAGGMNVWMVPSLWTFCRYSRIGQKKKRNINENKEEAIKSSIKAT
jgi:hypothetical protein